MKVNYYINGVHFDTYGVKVSGSRGLLNALKMREPVKVIWPDHHGEVIDLAAPRYESREIILECYIKAAHSTAFILAVQSFLAAFQAIGLQRLMIDVNDGQATRKALVYEVYPYDEVEISKKWNATLMIGTFNLKIREPEPVKRVYKFVAATGAMTANLTITTADPVNVYWGDGNNDLDVTTATGQIINIYAAEGTYYIVISGVIENITGITTNCTLVWTRL
jgi:hypothetical protein